MKRLKLFQKKPEKKIELDKGSILVAEHKGDVNYSRYVKFKQLAPQFWEKMDSPLFAVYLEKFEDAFNQSNWAKGHAVILDYKMAIDMSKSNHDAWGLCFALISYEKDEDTIRILVLGDSFTFGYGVNGDETYPKLLEEFPSVIQDMEMGTSGVQDVSSSLKLIK